MRRMRVSRTVVAGLVALTLVGCAAGATGSSSGPSATAEQGRFRFGINFEPDSWNPMLVPNTTYTQMPYESLLKFAADGVTVEPSLAEEWELTPDSLRLTLRDGVTFHDGTPFDAAAVVANIEHIQQSGTEWASTLAVVESVTVVDDHEIVLELSAPNPSLPYNLAGRGNAMISPAAIEDGSWEQVPNGTGPFELDVARTVEGSVYVFSRFAGYHSPDAVGPDTVEVHFIEDGATRYNALVTGQVDAARIDPAMVGEAESGGLGTTTWPALAYHLFLFDRAGLFADRAVRQAVCHAMPLESINAAAYEGVATFPTQRVSPDDPAYAQDVAPYEYDLDAAKALMAEAGNPEISFQMPFMSGQEGTYALVQESFGEIGVDIELLPMGGTQYFSEYFTGKHPLIFNQANSEDGGMYNYYTVRFAADGDLNPAGVEPPAELAALFEQALATSDADEQAAAFQEMSRVIHDEALDCGFMNIPQTIAFDPDVVGEVPVTVFAPSALRYAELDLLG